MGVLTTALPKCWQVFSFQKDIKMMKYQKKEGGKKKKAKSGSLKNKLKSNTVSIWEKPVYYF